jgi:SET domain-containing protein
LPSPSSSSHRTPRRAYRIGRSKSGLGLFALKPFKKGDFIAYYRGRRILNKVADELDTKYMFELNSRWTLDGSSRRNVARYINHSCRPNAETDVKKLKVIITAKKSIEPGEEITYNYGRDYFDFFIKPHGCRCVACKRNVARVRSPRKNAPKKKKS